MLISIDQVEVPNFDEEGTFGGRLRAQRTAQDGGVTFTCVPQARPDSRVVIVTNWPDDKELIIGMLQLVGSGCEVCDKYLRHKLFSAYRRSG